MEIKRFFPIILITILVLTIIAILIANQSSASSTLKLYPPTGLQGIRTGNGYLLTWNEAKNASAYNLYLFESPTQSTKDSVRSIQNVQSPYLLLDSDLPLGVDYIALTSVRNYRNGELESDLCKVYRISKVSELPPPILNCQGAYNFDGQFEANAETCFQQAADDRIFIRWFPVQGAAGYNVYYGQGSQISIPFTNVASLSSTSYSYLSDPLSPAQCWTFAVTSIDSRGLESGPSQFFTTCVA